MQTFVRMLASVAEQVDLELAILGVGDSDVHTRSVDFQPVAHRAKSELEFARALSHAVRARRVVLPTGSVIMANAEHYVWAMRGAGPPVVLVAHGVASETLVKRRGWLLAWGFKHLIEAPAIGRAKRIVAVSDRVRQYYAETYPFLASAKLTSIRVGVVLEDFLGRPKGPVASVDGFDCGTPVVLFVGRLSREKNLELFVKACELLALGGSQFRAIVVGDGPLAPLMVRATRSHRWLAWIHELTHDQILDLMAVSSVLAICSTHEGLPTVLLEAIASGLPVVSTDVGRSRELLHPPIGTVVGPSPKDFSIALERMMSQDRASVRSAAQSVLGAIDFRATALALRGIFQEVRSAAAEGLE